MNKIKYAIYHGDSETGGVYNVLASFLRGILKGFQEADICAYTYQECIEKNIDFDVALGFNVAGIENWGKVLKTGKINVLWNVDSIFGQNFNVFNECSKFDNFLLLNVSTSDFLPANNYLPNLKHCFMPHATDKDLWKQKDLEKEHDLVLFSSLRDYENMLEQYKNNKFLFGLINEMVEIMLKQPNLTFWEVFVMIKNSCQINLNLNDYARLSNIVCFIVEQKQKIKLIQALANLNVKVFGNELWKKYIKGKVQYMGAVDFNQSIDTMNKAKISLNCQISSLNYGFHERFLNASSVATFNLVSATPFIRQEFGDSFGYFDHSTFEDVEQKAQYYLLNDDERIEKAKEAQKIVHEKHLWKHRALAINELFTQV